MQRNSIKKEQLEEGIWMGNKSVAPANPNAYDDRYASISPHIPSPENSPQPFFSEYPDDAVPAEESVAPVTTTITSRTVLETHSGVAAGTTQSSTTNTLGNQPVSSVTTNPDMFAPHETLTTHFASAIRPTPVYVADSELARDPSIPPVVNLPLVQRRSSSIINVNTDVPSKAPSTPLIRHASVFVLNSQATHVPSDATLPAASTKTPNVTVKPSTTPKATMFVLKSERSLISTKSPAPAAVTNASLPDSITHVDSSAVRRSTSIPTISAHCNASASPASSSKIQIPDKMPVTAPRVDSISMKLYNTSPLFSPDTSATSPTLDLPLTPSPRPSLTRTFVPAKSTTSSKKIQSPPPPASSKPLPTSTANPPKLTVSQVKTPSPSRIIPEPAVSNDFVSMSTHRPEPIKLPIASSDQHDKKSEPHAKEGHEEFTQTSLRTHSFGTSPIVPPIETSERPKEKSFVLSIIAVPSFALRSTAVTTFPPEDPIVSEQTQITHRDISIFKYHITQKEIEQSIGNHSKATMFKMDTRLKQTPMPTPSLLFLTKNFNDGSDEPDDSSVVTATFSSLGLDTDLGIEPAASSFPEAHFNNRKLQKNMEKSSSPDPVSDATNARSMALLLIGKQTLFSSSQDATARQSKPAVHVARQSISTQTGSELLVNFQQRQPGHTSSTFGFTISPTTKASESISRSERLFTRR